jgi:uncharacterized NAD(P)/FAD-binding protein YdhS
VSSLSGPLSDLVRRIDALGPRPSPIELVRAVQGARLSASDVAHFVRNGRQSYNRSPVIVQEHYEILVLTWSAGQGSVPHEHSSSVCVVRVVQGEAAEGCFSIAADGFVDLEHEEIVRTGEVTSLHDAGIHTLRNASAEGENLVTLHVYAPPLRDGRRFVARPEAQGRRRRPIDDIPTIAVVGGGFSGTMTAAHVLRGASSPLRVALIERRGAIGEGVAYATREQAHLLNVPAGGMSAWPDEPADFVKWASRRTNSVAPTDFLPRQWYGDYVRDTLCAASQASNADLSILFDEVRRVVRRPGAGWLLHLARGSSFRADAIVLAIGHCPPSDPLSGRWTGPKARFIGDPWRPFAMNAVGGDEAILVLGSGLTAVDTVLSLSEHPRSAKITLVSPKGLLPHGHAPDPKPPAELDELVSGLFSAPGCISVRELLRELRRLARELDTDGRDWRSVVDGLRPFTSSLWQGMSLIERRRFLSRLRPFWEVHRHRTAPQVSARFQSLLESGQVEVIAGRVESVREEPGQVRALVRSRKTRKLVDLSAGWVVNCTGPLPSNRPESNPAIGSLMLRRLLRIDDLALGIDTTDRGTVIAADGSEVPDLLVVGTLRKPALWESTAVPELRGQAADAAARVLDYLKSSGLNPSCATERRPARIS